jgi:mRNA interferase HicA
MKLPALTPKAVLAALLKAGFEFRHTKGSHVALVHPITKRRTLIAMHAKELHRGAVKLILKQAGLTEGEFRQLL